MEYKRIGFEKRRVGQDNFPLVALKAPEFPLRPRMVRVVRVHGGVQRTRIGKDGSFHRNARWRS
jgi:hypothetical protein